MSDPFEEGDLAVLSDIGLHEDVLRAILSDTDSRRRTVGPHRPRVGFRRRNGGGDRQARSVISDEQLIRAALAAAAAADPRDVPIGAVVVDAAGVELARAANAREERGDPTAHAEILALRAAAAVVGDGWRLEGATLAVTVEPCTMCAGALVLARVSRLVFGAWEPKTGAVGSLWDVVRDRRLTHRPQVRGGVLAAECAAPLEEFFARQRHEARRPRRAPGPDPGRADAAGRAGSGHRCGHQNQRPSSAAIDGVMNDRTTRVSNSRPRPMVVPIWPMTRQVADDERGPW